MGDAFIKPNIPITSRKRHTKKVITPTEKLIKRINREFDKKKLIGDILIDDREYSLLVEYFRKRYQYLINSYTHIVIDPIFATVLVQIGIKRYDSDYWGNVGAELGLDYLPSSHQTWIADSYYKTLKKHNKLLISKSARVRNILMHGLVSDYYANDFFNFLFAYYTIDLERDLSRNSREMMNSLIDAILKPDNTDRTYLLVKQTQDAVLMNTRGCKIRIRRFLRMMDDYFWEQKVPLNPVSRLSKMLIKWQEDSLEFKYDYNKYHGTINTSREKKRYSSPYIKCDLSDTTFRLILPVQLIRFDDGDSVKWRITINGDTREIDGQVYKAITGYKTEEIEVILDRSNLFDEIIIKLLSDQKKIRNYKINSNTIRFFDGEGDFINNDSLTTGIVYSFNEAGYTPISEALLDSEIIGDFVKSYFEFEIGDIIRLPDGNPLSIGQRINEGLLKRGVLSNAYAIIDDNKVDIYKKPPSILLKIPKTKANGTLIKINDKRYRLFDFDTIVLELKDGSDEIGYLIKLSDYGCTKDGLYQVYIDVPNDRTNRNWSFVLINNIYYEFEEAPYIFKTKGSIILNNDLNIKSLRRDIEKLPHENIFNFNIVPLEDKLVFSTKLNNKEVLLNFEIPVFKWKFDEEGWNIERPLDLWHSNFPTKIFLKYPKDKVALFIDSQLEDEYDHYIRYEKSETKGIFECDMTKFRSWFNKEEIFNTIYIDLGDDKQEFFKVITRSYIESKLLKEDFDNNCLIGEFDIVGNSNYYVDIFYNDSLIADKVLIKDGRVTFYNPLSSGKYKVIIYEDEEDDTGFGSSYFNVIDEFYRDLINPYDLSGKNIEIRFIKRKESSIFNIRLKNKYHINNLKLIDVNNKHNYSGKMHIRNKNGSLIESYHVKVKFFDLNNLKYTYITFPEDNEYYEFLFDNNEKVLVKEEEPGLKRTVRYRRYDVIYPEDYMFIVEFIENHEFRRNKAY